jgi:hypothetical protein
LEKSVYFVYARINGKTRVAWWALIRPLIIRASTTASNVTRGTEVVMASGKLEGERAKRFAEIEQLFGASS